MTAGPQRGDDEARVGAAGQPLRLADHPARVRPRLQGSIAELGEQARGLSAFPPARLGPVQGRCRRAASRVLPTSCTTRSVARPSKKHPANRSTRPIVRSVAPRTSAPAFEVIVPPRKSATTSRPLKLQITSNRGTFCAHREIPLQPGKSLLQKNFLKCRTPMHTPGEKSG